MFKVFRIFLLGVLLVLRFLLRSGFVNFILLVWVLLGLLLAILVVFGVIFLVFPIFEAFIVRYYAFWCFFLVITVKIVIEIERLFACVTLFAIFCGLFIVVEFCPRIVGFVLVFSGFKVNILRLFALVPLIFASIIIRILCGTGLGRKSFWYHFLLVLDIIVLLVWFWLQVILFRILGPRFSFLVFLVVVLVLVCLLGIFWGIFEYGLDKFGGLWLFGRICLFPFKFPFIIVKYSWVVRFSELFLSCIVLFVFPWILYVLPRPCWCLPCRICRWSFWVLVDFSGIKVLVLEIGGCFIVFWTRFRRLEEFD